MSHSLMPCSPPQRHPEAGTFPQPYHPQCLQPCWEPDPHPTFEDPFAEGKRSEGGHSLCIPALLSLVSTAILRTFCH